MTNNGKCYLLLENVLKRKKDEVVFRSDVEHDHNQRRT